MTKFTLAGPFGFNFIDHMNGTTVPRLIGHAEKTEWNSLLLDNHNTFTIDGEPIWDHLKRNGIGIQSQFASGKILTAAYTVTRDGEQIATFETTSQYVHEEDEAAHPAAGKVPTQGFYRIQTSEKNLDLLFVTILAIARSGATGDNGGDRAILFGK